MDQKELLSHVDHTLLSQTSVPEEIRMACEDAAAFGTASVCIPPCYVRFAKECLQGRAAVCTVIGFPSGFSTTAAKCAETRDAVQNGADEIDMVANLCWIRAGKWDEVREDVAAVRKACPGKILKVIVETCLLTQEEKIRMCDVVREAGADYIKTSTGFSKGGATPEDVALFAKHVKAPLRIKAAGGISSLEDAENYLRLGADRLGTSRIIRIVKENAQSKGDSK